MRLWGSLGLILMAMTAHAQAIQWYVSYDFADRLARRTGKLLMVDLYVEESRTSQGLLERTYWQSDVSRASYDFIPLRLDGTRDGAMLADRYGITQFSTILFLEPNGRVVSRVYGFAPAAQLLFEMRRARTAYAERRIFEPRLAANPNDLEAILAMAAVKALAGDTVGASQLIARAERKDPKLVHRRFTSAYTALADSYRGKELFDNAIVVYRKAKKAAKLPDEAAYAGINIGISYRQKGDAPKAAAELRSVLKMPRISRLLAERAQRTLASLNGAGRPRPSVSR